MQMLPRFSPVAIYRHFVASGSRAFRVSPVEAGLPAGGDRRSPGLRREELAMLSRIIVYTVASEASFVLDPNRPVGRVIGYDVDMDRKALILETVRKLTLARGVVPSLNDVAAAAGVSKGGLIHHFPSRAALVRGLAEVSLNEIDAAMTAASADGTAAETWLRLSVPTGEDVALFRSMAIAHRAVESPGNDVAIASREALERWEAMIEKETGDSTRARVIRLVGDGLAANVITGIELAPTPEQLDVLINVLVHQTPGARP